jgi:hypothetical protein
MVVSVVVKCLVVFKQRPVQGSQYPDLPLATCHSVRIGRPQIQHQILRSAFVVVAAHR